ncbi:CAP-Gly domain-containing linker protein 1 isoform X5 [Hydra vulgaris]|uniref:CAP-Gly domain-containing linker protein 1 isoform X5 n=2 Tax=Hydra vulgaris TaxID=6087 RepID=A0ABM4CMS9_HYDVU
MKRLKHKNDIRHLLEVKNAQPRQRQGSVGSDGSDASDLSTQSMPQYSSYRQLSGGLLGPFENSPPKPSSRGSFLSWGSDRQKNSKMNSITSSGIKTPSSRTSVNSDLERPSSAAPGDTPLKPGFCREVSSSKLPLFRREISLPQMNTNSASSLKKDNAENKVKPPTTIKTNIPATPRGSTIPIHPKTTPKTVAEQRVLERNIPEKGTRSGISSISDNFNIGDDVIIKGTNKKGKLLYVGETRFAAGCWAGVVLDDDSGKNDGSVAGVRYFTCPPLRGVFVKEEKLEKVSKKNTLLVKTPIATETTPTENDSENLVRDIHTKEENLAVGDHVEISIGVGTQEGILQYIGLTGFAKGTWCGVELKEPIGKNDGAVAGTRYFQCDPKHGIFTQLQKVRKIPNVKNTYIKNSDNVSIANSSSTSVEKGKKESKITPHKSILKSQTHAADSTFEHAVETLLEANLPSTYTAQEKLQLEENVVNNSYMKELEKKLYDLQSQLHSKENELHSRDTEIYSLKTDKEKTQFHEQELKNQITKNEKEKQEIQNALNEYKQKNEELHFQLEELAVAAEEKKSQLYNKDNELHSLKADKEKTATKILRIQESNFQLQNQVAKHDREKHDMQNELNEYKQKIEDLRFQYEELAMHTMASEEKKISIYHEKEKDIEIRLKDKDKELLNMQLELEKLKVLCEEETFKVDEKEMQLHAKNQEVDKLQELLEVAKNNINLEVEENNKLKEEIKKLKEQIDKLSSISNEKDLKSFELKVEELLNIESKLNQQIYELNKELEKKCAEIQSVTESNEFILKEHIAIKAKLEVAECRINQYIEDKKWLEEEVLKVSRNSGDNAQQLMHYDQQIQSKNREIADLQDKIAKMTEQNYDQLKDMQDKMMKEKQSYENEKNIFLKESMNIMEEQLTKLKDKYEENELCLKKNIIELENSKKLLLLKENEIQKLNSDIKILQQNAIQTLHEDNMHQLSEIKLQHDLQIKESLKKHDALLEVNEELHNKVEKSNLALKKMEEEAEFLRKQIKDNSTSASLLESQLYSLKEQLSIAHSNQMKAEKDYEEQISVALSNQKKAEKDYEEQISVALSNQKKAEKDYEEQISVALSNQKKAEKDYEDINKQLNEIVMKKDKLQAEFNQKCEQEANYKKELEVLHDQLNLERGQNVVHKNKLVEENEIETLRKQLEMLEVANTSLTAKLKNNNAKSDSSHVEELKELLNKVTKAKNEKDAEVEFLNSIIVDLQKKNKELDEKIKVLTYGDDIHNDLNDTISPIKPNLRMRPFCDICDVFDIHDTEDCPTQTNENYGGVQHRGSRTDERPYCLICESFGHTQENCDDEQTF